MTSLRFTRNPYDWCVMNREIEGTQQTVSFYVDDIKLSYRNENVLLDTVKDLAARYGKIKDRTITRRDVHDFLGITFDFSKRKQLRVIMNSYVQEIIGEAGFFSTHDNTKTT